MLLFNVENGNYGKSRPTAYTFYTLITAAQFTQNNAYIDRLRELSIKPNINKPQPKYTFYK